MSAASRHDESLSTGVQDKPWYRNSYITAYWEMEDVAMDIYEMSLTPVAIAGFITTVYLLVGVLGFILVLVGHLILRAVAGSTVPAVAWRTFGAYSISSTMKLSSIGASLIALPIVLMWTGLSLCKASSKLWAITINLTRIISVVLYGMFAGAAGSSICAQVMPETKVLPVTEAMVCGALGGLLFVPLTILGILTYMNHPTSGNVASVTQSILRDQRRVGDA
ncbi:hypothetical protein M408DRAFT_27140 [Serendipita vermifera MAFF 305830]|uniref:Uncharacterized protein n=1 Tax=Serendipita vermifera MAFF 305830 TaxID=933852 RepID=A0A0C3AWE4_SERVB|nr:hypothetical protein M408DRAFT_27140 [Serendipita vermifera MAFF 305830]